MITDAIVSQYICNITRRLIVTLKNTVFDHVYEKERYFAKI